MKRREIVVDLVKAAFVALIVKVMASSSRLIPWNSFLDNLCIVFAICVTVLKICRLTLSLRNFLSLAVAALISLYTCVSMGQYDLLITMIAICLLIDEDLDAYLSVLFTIQVFILVIHIAAAGLLSLFGADAYFWEMTEHRLRFNGGFIHANVLSCYILSCMLLFAWRKFMHISSNQFAWMACIAVLSYITTRSRTGLLLNLSLILLLFLAQNKNKLVISAINPILLLLFPALSAIVFWAQKQLVFGNRIALLLDNLLTGRIKYAAYAYLRSGVTWLPRYLDYADAGVVSWTPEWNLNTFTFDNLFSFMFMQMGMIWIGIFIVTIAVVCKKLAFKYKIFILIWVLFAMVEVHGLNCFKFFPMILLSTLFSEREAEDHRSGND